MEQKKIIKFKKQLTAQVKFDPIIAKKLVKTKKCYKAQSINLKNLDFLEDEKTRLSTPKWEKVTNLLEHFKEKGETTQSSLGKTLLGLYKKNSIACKNNTPAINSNLISIVSKPETLILAYKEIKGNKGALSDVSQVSKDTFNNWTPDQKKLYLKSMKLPDETSLYHFFLISNLIKKGLYPWGTSTRIYIDKPGQPGKKRPITMPPFIDKLVQKAIEMVLQAIYEPYFETTNRSFGFRSNKGTQDAMIALTTKETNGMRTAIEGDIEAAFDTVDKNKLLEILSQKIKDKKFLKFIKDRLHYELLEKETGKRFQPDVGIPQGGIDSPYLFNIYMSELDNYVLKNIKEEIDLLNENIKPNRVFSKTYNSVRAEKKKLIRHLNKVKSTLKNLPNEDDNPKVANTKIKLFKIVKAIRLNEHKKNRISSSTINKKKLRFFYVRYADDWILLTNGDTCFANYLKNKIATFLKEELKLNLSPNKTLITNITKNYAKFLGFEVKISGRGALHRSPAKLKLANQIKKNIVSKKSGLLVWAQPDKQRLINKFHMKGFCTRKGFPTTLPWLSCLEAHAIIERFNASILGLANFFLPIIRNRAKIHRWIYILRYACLKTFAQKYKCSINKIFKRFGHNLNSKNTQTIRVRVLQKIRGQEYYKDWTLLTYQDLTNIVKYKEKKNELIKTFYDRENGIIGEYPLKKGRTPKVTNEDFLEKISIPRSGMKIFSKKSLSHEVG
jgi:retron-type reverse transcriptase